MENLKLNGLKAETKMDINDCKILWDKRKGFRISKRDREAIKKDLRTMSKLIEEAMSYTKEKLLKENRETVVQFWLNTNTPTNYCVDLNYDRGFGAWLLTIVDADAKKPVGEIVSDKWMLMQLLMDEDAEVDAIC
jgi:uncharacterized FlaG/YvyC family protein